MREVRREERALIDWYRGLVRECMQTENVALAQEIAALPDQIRGYENIKLESIRKVKALAEEKRRELSSSAANVPGVATGQASTGSGFAARPSRRQSNFCGWPILGSTMQRPGWALCGSTGYQGGSQRVQFQPRKRSRQPNLAGGNAHAGSKGQYRSIPAARQQAGAT